MENMEVVHRISWDLSKNHADFIFFTRESTDQNGDIHRKWPLVIEQFAMGNGPSSSMVYDDLPIEKKRYFPVRYEKSKQIVCFRRSNSMALSPSW
jgi:hypothetical protein